ncbi:PsiF family protein [Methyloversatilis sp.]|uniref:PsiF family protein n=1 Tax=Methyloversatilis sp. TaxID=2569862 RepID=UPI002736E07D|nr:PsiF family protein [Methyloversatilis sp.]MDP2870807.1 PsiF family protein [Methyloversatilis sp.]MDP3287013.1 PsiF family protein [Methyloversatilis sp.]MDP3456216.1 PsiF family protein [Methyloversatilis sp.]MDP3577168.1 PsiF family protein [Methyloversatilis sp.]
MSAYRFPSALTVLSAAFLLVSSNAAVAGPQQEKMKACNAEAKEKALKGDERRSFMSGCLSSGSAAKPTLTADEASALKDRKKQCRSEATDKALKGEERKSFIAECVKA